MELINQLAQSGILGLLLAIAVVGLFYLYRETRSLQDSRVKDLKDIETQVLEPLKSIKLTVETILSILNNKKP